MQKEFLSGLVCVCRGFNVQAWAGSTLTFFDEELTNIQAGPHSWDRTSGFCPKMLFWQITASYWKDWKLTIGRWILQNECDWSKAARLWQKSYPQLFWPILRLWAFKTNFGNIGNSVSLYSDVVSLKHKSDVPLFHKHPSVVLSESLVWLCQRAQRFIAPEILPR